MGALRRPPMCRRRERARPGFTLIEVILALVVLGGSLAILGEVMHLANREAVDARAETQAQLLADSLMDQILAGVEDESPVSRQPLETGGDDRWLYSVATGASDVEGVYPLEVIVEQDLEPQFNPVKFRLMRWMPVELAADEASEEAQADQEQAARSGAGQPPGGGGAGFMGGGPAGGTQP